MRNNYIKFAATLAIICLASSGLLSVVYNITRPKIEEQRKQEESRSLKDVFPQAKDFQEVKEAGEVLYYKALGPKGELLGYAFKASGRGYSSDIVTMVGMDKDGIIKNIKILSQNETPGLGSRIVEVIQKETLWDVLFKKIKLGKPPVPWFQAQFSGKNVNELEKQADTITGATISSSAVIRSIKGKALQIQERIKNGG